MSGGVDSSVAAALLVRAGHDVTGAFVVNYDNGDGACWRNDYTDALRVSAKLGVPLIRLDFVKEYKKMVLDYMYKEYEEGKTPNPDVLCNKFIKFGAWQKKAKELGFEYIATGHYASLKEKNGIYKLLEAKDKNKDQTYFLHLLSQDQLNGVLFPLGKYSKPEVRKLAKKFDLPTAEKEESMGICFIGEVPMKDFLMKKIKPKEGNIILKSKVIGTHDGLPFYTIGERGMGLDKGNGQPLYVIEKRMKTNELVVGYMDDPKLSKKETWIEKINWISGQTPKLPLKCKVRLRHRQDLSDCVVEEDNSKFRILFNKAQRAPTPGQFAVFYLRGECLGGGVIIF